MGLGYTYKCKCTSPEPILLGVGMGYPLLCEETRKEMSDGKYGENVQQIVKKYPRGGVDCEYRLYICACGRWENDTKKTINESVNQEGSKKHIFYHLCPDCGKLMRAVPPNKAKLVCPKCGEAMTDIQPEIRWD